MRGSAREGCAPLFTRKACCLLLKKHIAFYLTAPRRPPGRDMSRNKTKKSIYPTPNRPRTLSAVVIVTLPKSIQEGPKLFQKPSKIEPKWCQNRSKRDPKRAQVAQEVKVASPRASRGGHPRYGVIFGLLLGSQNFTFMLKILQEGLGRALGAIFKGVKKQAQHRKLLRSILEGFRLPRGRPKCGFRLRENEILTLLALAT